VMNAAARLVCSARKYEHITPLLCDLHWLRVPERGRRSNSQSKQQRRRGLARASQQQSQPWSAEHVSAAVPSPRGSRPRKHWCLSAVRCGHAPFGCSGKSTHVSTAGAEVSRHQADTCSCKAHLTKCTAHLTKCAHLTNLHTCAAFCRYRVTVWVGVRIESRPFRSTLSFPGAKSPQRELSLPWNFRSVEHSLLGMFAPVEVSFLGSERCKNFRSYETVFP